MNFAEFSLKVCPLTLNTLGKYLTGKDLVKRENQSSKGSKICKGKK